jgi:putative transposase
MISSMSRKGNCWDTQSSMVLNVGFDLTRVGIGATAFVLTCRSEPAFPAHH